MAVLTLVGLMKAKAVNVVSLEEQVARLGKVLAAASPLEARVYACAGAEPSKLNQLKCTNYYFND